MARFKVRDETQSARVDGTTQYFTCPVTPSTTGFNIAIWVKSDAIGQSDAVGNHILDWETAFNTDGFRLTNGMAIRKTNFVVNNGGSNSVSILPPDASLVIGEWTHFAATFAPNDAKFYINGVLVGSDTSCTMTAATGQLLTLGRRSFVTGAPRPAVGDYKEFIIHNTTTPWTQAQVTQIYQGTARPSGLTGYYPLNGDIKDYSGNNNHLTATFTNNISFSNRVPGQFARRFRSNAKVDITSDILTGNATGQVYQVTSSILIRGAGRDIYQSTDNGATWSTAKYTSPNTNDSIALMQRASNGYLYVGFGNRSFNFGDLVRSTDNGATWTKVLTGESCGWRYYMAENSQGHLYIAEYSSGDQDANEIYGYNIWRSTDNGANWTKFYTAPKQTTPGSKDGIRHIHWVFCDSQDQLYTGFGDIALGFASPSGKTFKLNSNGTIGSEITYSSGLPEGNGMIAAIEADNGKIFFMGDLFPFKYYTHVKGTTTFDSAVNLGYGFDDNVNPSTWDVVKGKDGVIYIAAYGSPGRKVPVIFASPDDGLTWKILYFTYNVNISLNVMSLNRSLANSRIFIQLPNNNYISIPDYTRDQLRALGA